MSAHTDPTQPIDAYKAIIDGLVAETRRSLRASRVFEKGIFSNAVDAHPLNAFVASLSPDQRGLLAAMLQEERDGAIYDVLAHLTWWIVARDVGFTFNGEPMPVELSGMGLHGDYVGRRDGWEWPGEADGTA